ncbi:MAG: magnesium-translocating P-type ATPase [Phycisphaeraceae bacterium]|nr:magnesium-translocating P-type ATPase [Phycisphaeraceae bacterium]
MVRRHGSVFSKSLLAAMRRPTEAIRVSPLLLEVAAQPPDGVFQRLDSSPQGLTTDEAQHRLDKHGPNVVTRETPFPRLRILLHALTNPLVILLSLLAGLSVVTGDVRDAVVMMIMVVLGLVLRLAQEAKADAAAASLKAMISVTATVMRNGKPTEIPVSEVVPGDVVRLAAGDMIPGDVRLVSAKDLFVIQGALTGESFPVEKFDVPFAGSTSGGAADIRNACFLGASVESGSALGVVVATGFDTYLGGMAHSLAAPLPPTSFDRGVSKFTWLMIRLMLVMVPLVFLINGLTKHDWTQAFFFALAVAVGMTPEMLPMIVSVCLSKGAIAMSGKKVIVKRLNSIQNLGAMDVLCTDKTGTLTLDRVILERYCNVVREDDEGALELAYINSHFQTGLRNLLDRAVLQHQELHGELGVSRYARVDEIPFDFTRRMMSVVVSDPDGKRQIIAKGAPESVYSRCRQFELDGQFYPMTQLLMDELKDEYEQLSADGFRVLALAYREVPAQSAYGKDDERDLILKGYLAFLDPPKDSAVQAVAAMRKHGIAVKVLTGDNELVARKICRDVGIPVEMSLSGSQIEAMSDVQLADAAEKASLLARLSPGHKQRVIRALQSRGHVVGFLGDGINDAPALRQADVGISVDTAVDIAKESADVILLEKNLLVLEEGVLEGRKVFANIVKYIRMGASSNFGNMLSVVGASAFLPFLPMLPIQILTNCLLYDFSQVPIPTDDVEEEQIARPTPWDIGQITRFILLVGPCSSIFDYATFFVMLYLFKCWDPGKASLFQTGWFVESLLTQTLIIHIIRTRKIPFIQSRASWPLTMTSLIIGVVGIGLVYSPLASSLDFTPLPPLYWPLLAGILLGYTLLTQGMKVWLMRRKWI